MKRRKSRVVTIGDRKIGGNNPILIQSMATVKTSRVKPLLKQIQGLADVGCELVRVSILNQSDAKVLPVIVAGSSVPICADVHFNFQFALWAIEAGVAKVRINPGNIGGKANIVQVIRAAKRKKVAIRIGVNSGSLESGIYSMRQRHRGMVNSLKRVIRIAEAERFTNLVVSIKSSDPVETIEANRLLAKEVLYPIHLGVTATGAGIDAVIKSTAALSTLLAEGIGDTMRVSLTADPREEIHTAQKILQALKLREYPYEVMACPTCGRTEIRLEKIVREVERRLREEYGQTRPKYTSIAIMGCVVNGPGEAKDADIGVAGGRGFGFIFKKGKRIRKVHEKDLVDALLEEIRK